MFMARQIKKNIIAEAFEELGGIVNPNEIDGYINILWHMLEADAKTAKAFKQLISKIKTRR